MRSKQHQVVDHFQVSLWPPRHIQPCAATAKDEKECSVGEGHSFGFVASNVHRIALLLANIEVATRSGAVDPAIHCCPWRIDRGDLYGSQFHHDVP